MTRAQILARYPRGAQLTDKQLARLHKAVNALESACEKARSASVGSSWGWCVTWSETTGEYRVAPGGIKVNGEKVVARFVNGKEVGL